MDNGRNINELTYAEGKVYKVGFTDFIQKSNAVKSSITPDGIHSDYYKDENLDPLFPWFGVRTYPNGDKLVKRYYATKNFNDSVGYTGGKDISGCDLAPDINMWVYYTEHLGTDSFEISFNAENIDLLHKVCDYYKLPFPLPPNTDFDGKEWGSNEIYDAIERANHDWLTNPLFEGDFKWGQVRFEKGKATLIKVYRVK